jgi:hypothetical protein
VVRDELAAGRRNRCEDSQRDAIAANVTGEVADLGCSGDHPKTARVAAVAGTGELKEEPKGKSRRARSILIPHLKTK